MMYVQVCITCVAYEDVCVQPVYLALKEKIYTCELNVYTASVSVPVRVHLKISLQKLMPL